MKLKLRLTTLAAAALSLSLWGGTAHASNTDRVTVTADGPHVADGRDRCQVVVALADANGAPVLDGDVILEIAPPFFTAEIGQEVLHLPATSLGDGRYVASFAETVASPYRITAIDQASGESAGTLVEFNTPLGVPTGGGGTILLGRSARRLGILAGADKATDDAKANCGKFFDELDNQFYPPLVKKKIDDPATPQADKDKLKKRMEDLEAVLEVVDLDMTLEAKQAEGKALTQAEKDALAAAAAAAKAAFQRISADQIAILKTFFGNPVVPDKFQQCTEFFNNFQLTDFAKSVKNIEDAAADRPIAGDKIVTRGPDGAGAHIRWAKFAKVAIGQGVDADLWRTLIPTLAKGSSITVDVLKKPTPKQLDDTGVGNKRKEFDPLRPGGTDTQAQKDAKLQQVLDKLVDLIKKIRIDKTTIGMAPGSGGNRAVALAVTGARCASAAGPSSQPVSPAVNGLVSLATDELGNLFGYGVDPNGRTYVAAGTLVGSQAQFTITGLGLSPSGGVAETAFTGTLNANNQFDGTIQGIAVRTVNGQDETCTWQGSFHVDAPCQTDANGLCTQVDQPCQLDGTGQCKVDWTQHGTLLPPGGAH